MNQLLNTKGILKKNFIYNFLLTGSNLLFPLLTFPYLSRILGAEGLGICNFIISYGQNFMIIAALGMPVYGTREIAKVGDDKAKRSKLFFELISIHLLFTFFLLAIYVGSVILSADIREYKDLALLGGSLILFNVFSIQWLFTGVNDFKYITIRSVIIRALSIIAIFLFVKKKDDFTIYFIILISTIFLIVLVDVYNARKFISKKIELSFKGIGTHIKPIFILGIYMVLTSIYSILPTTLLGFLSTKSAVGYYYSANKIIRVIISVFSALITVMIPRLNLILEENRKDEYLLSINNALNIVITFGVPAAFFVFLMANPIVMLLAGKDFANSVFLIKVMSPIILIVAFAEIFVLLILSIHRKDNGMVILSIIGMTISLLINIVFIPHFAEKATAFSQLTAEFLVTFASFFLAKQVLKFKFPIKSLLFNLILALPFALFTAISSEITNNILTEILFASVFCGGYFIFYQTKILKNKLVISFLEPYAKFLEVG